MELKQIKEFPGYLISEDGKVFSTKSSRYLEGYVNKAYPCITLRKGGGTYLKRIHRLVAETFIPNPGNKPHVRHIDGNPTNCNKNNLAWCTAKENAADRSIHGTENMGSKNGQSKLTEDTVRKARELWKQGVSLPKLCSMFGVSSVGTMSVAVRGITWKHVDQEF